MYVRAQPGRWRRSSKGNDDRTEDVTASFIKELPRRAALNAADEDRFDRRRAAATLRVTDTHIHAALDILLDDCNRLIRSRPAERRRPS